MNEFEETERAMARDMQLAALIQQRLLPAKAPKVEGMDLGAKTVAARSVGGDYYDFLRFPDGKVGLIAGDVAGKGTAAALLMSSLQARVHILFEHSDELARNMERLNRTTCPRCPKNSFITFFAGIVNPATGELTYASAGHNPPLIVRADGKFETLVAGGVVLGILATAKYEEAYAQLEVGDILVLSSDSVAEAAGEERLANIVYKLRDRPATEIVEEIHKAVRVFADDITVVIARRV